MNVAKNNATQTARPLLRIGVWDIGVDHIRLHAPRFGETGCRIRVSGGFTCA